MGAPWAGYKALESGGYITTEVFTALVGICPPADIIDRAAGISLTTAGLLTIEPGYPWDGATGAIDTPDWLPASLGHDALYDMLIRGLLPMSCRAAADEWMRLRCIADGMPPARAWYSYCAVRSLGWSRAQGRKPATERRQEKPGGR